MQNFLDTLNDIQKEAVLTTEGALLVLAGAGTGKTKVLTSRIAHIINEKKARADEILAVTFTNKAAKEMQTRVMDIANDPMLNMYIGTFHSIGLKILKIFYSKMGLESRFIILDPDEALEVVKQILEARGIDTKVVSHKHLYYKIERLKDKAKTPDNMSSKEDESIYNDLTLKKVYELYSARLKEMNAIDLSDLILMPLILIKSDVDVQNYLQTRFKYILVDEFQDTNITQYNLIKEIGKRHNNICCVGDDDQSIYSWRGAEVANILKFKDDFPGGKVLRLEQNYRSTANILGAASALIANNDSRWGKTLWTDKSGGDKVKIFLAYNENEEVSKIAENIKNYYGDGYDYNNMAILVRSSYQTRVLENGLLQNFIPFKLIGLVKFYDRLEIKDAVAYLRVISNIKDDMALERVINSPKRGIGKTTIVKIRDFANSQHTSLFEAIDILLSQNYFSAKVKEAIENFVELIKEIRLMIDSVELYKLLEMALGRSGYLHMYEEQKTEEADERLDNIFELIRDLKNFKSLEEFLEYVSLMAYNDQETNENKVSLMTMHGSKGLEFDVVFLPGWEENIFPSARSVEEGGLEEERRLAYVAITRAKKALNILHSSSRNSYGSINSNEPSRFLKEIPKEFKEEKANEFLYKPNWARNSFGGKSDSSQKNNYFSASSNSNSSSTAKVRIGARVNHTKFGFGVVKAVSGNILTIEFEDFGEHKIMQNYVELI